MSDILRGSNTHYRKTLKISLMDYTHTWVAAREAGSTQKY